MSDFGKEITRRVVEGVITGIVSAILLTPLKSLADQFIRSSGVANFDTYGIMSKYCEDLTEKAKKGQLNPAVGRDKEINHLIEVITKGGKNNACIVGESGVGKTALVEGLAYKIAKDEVPEVFKGKKIMKVNMVSLIAGMGYGQSPDSFITRIRALFEKAKKDDDIVLFIDEFHQVAKCADLFKTYMDRGEVRVIAATTISEYGFIATDPALERRFERITLEEPSKEVTKSILQYLGQNITIKDNIKVPDKSIDNIVDLTDRYIKGQRYPDKAIRVLQAAKTVCQNRVRISKNSDEPNEITEADIRKVISDSMNIPITELSAEEKTKLSNLACKLKQNIVGQDDIINTLSEAVYKGRLGITNINKPMASFLFTGTSGTGKTELAQLLGTELNNLIRIDMSNYSSYGSAKELLGAKIQGHKGELTDKVWAQPYSVILFDNIEKASSDVLNAISIILDRGEITDSNSKLINFRNTIIICTTNVGADKIIKASDNFHSQVYNDVMNKFGVDFLGQIDHILIFNKLTISDAKEISKIHINKFINRISNSKKINIKYSNDVIDYLISENQNFDSFGAKGIKKFIQEEVENPICNLISQDLVQKFHTIYMSVENGQLKFDIKNK